MFYLSFNETNNFKLNNIFNPYTWGRFSGT